MPFSSRRQKDRRQLEDAGQWAGKVLARYVAAANADERMRVLVEMDQPLPLDEDAALALYRVDPVVASAFIERHLPPGRRTDDEQAPWERLMESASARRDDTLFYTLYRRQATAERWLRDTEELARSAPRARCAPS